MNPHQHAALVRGIASRLSLCSGDEVRLIDLLLVELEMSRHASHDPPIYDLIGPYSDLERAYRRGHNDAMRSETPQVTLWRARVLLATRAHEVERGLAELRRNARTMEGHVEFDLSDGGDW